MLSPCRCACSCTAGVLCSCPVGVPALALLVGVLALALLVCLLLLARCVCFCACLEGASPQSRGEFPEPQLESKMLFPSFAAASNKLHHDRRVTSKSSHSTKVLLLSCSAPPQSKGVSQYSVRLRRRDFASRLPRRSSNVVSPLLLCLEGAPPQSKGWASLSSDSTEVLVLRFAAASKGHRHNRKVESPESHPASKELHQL